jgi:hypothetical protein
MGDQGLCESVCRESGWLGELALLVLFALRALWLQRARRTVETERDQLQEKVRELSLRPPAAPVTLQLAPHPSLTSLYPIGMSTSPADAQKAVKNHVSEGQGHEPTDPDMLDPPHEDEP